MSFMFSKHTLPRIAAAAALAFACASPVAAQTFTAKFGTATINEDQHEWIKRFKDRIEKRSDGKIKVEIYPANQLGAIPRQIEGMQLGTVEGWVGPPGFLVGLDQRFQVFDAPGIFEDRAHAFRTMTDPAMRGKLLGLGEAKGLKGVSMYVSSENAYVFRKPVRTLEDFKGLKVRVLATKIERRVMEEFGATPTPMDLGEVLSALQQGTIDGAKSAISIFVPFKYQNVAKYLTATHEAYIPTVAMMSKAFFERLPANLQTAVLEEGKALDSEIQDFSVKLKDGLYKVWEDNGGEIIRLSPAESAEMKRRVANVGAEIAKENPSVKAFYDEMLKVAERVK
ncbi:MAG: TRAP transporter substrate-binding protein [Rhodospirillales bacterium]